MKHALEIEHKYKREMPELSLSDAIGRESPYKPRGIAWFAAWMVVKHEKFRKGGLLHSDGKIELFYKSVVLVLFLTTCLLAVLGGITLDTKPQPAQGVDLEMCCPS